MIRGYLRSRAAPLAFLLLAAIAFPAVALLMGQSAEPALYALLMLGFVLVVYLVYDVFRYRRVARALDAVIENLSEARHALPQARGPIEARYHAITEGLYRLLAEQAERMARGAAETVDYYTMWMHQIKTPIAAMRLSLQQGADARLMERQLLEMERYVEMALQFVKLSDLSSDLVIGEYALAPIASACVKRYAPLFIAKRLKAQIGDLERTVTTDSKWLSFILDQLLSNAIKYTREGGSIRLYLEGGALIVQDTGIGIQPEDLARIFQKGFTGINGRIDRRASGLGLYMARRAAGRLSIRLYPESTPGKGTRMCLVFPPRETMVD